MFAGISGGGPELCSWLTSGWETDVTEIGCGIDSSDVTMGGVLEMADSSVNDVVAMVSLAATVLALTTGVSLIMVLID